MQKELRTLEPSLDLTEPNTGWTPILKWLY